MPVGRCLEVHLPAELLSIFFPLIQEGVGVDVEVGCTIKQLLNSQFGVSSNFIAGRITTIFLNRRAVDNPATAVVQDGALLALSGAMPGLVGATMRSGGYYAAMRGAMTHQNEETPQEARQGMITIKLFNLLLEELTPRLLQRGILLQAGRWIDFLADQPEKLRPRDYRIDGQPVPSERFRSAQDFVDEDETIRIKVQFGGVQP